MKKINHMNRPLIQLVPQDIINCYAHHYSSRGKIDVVGCFTGSIIRAFEYIKQRGVMYESDCPFHKRKEDCMVRTEEEARCNAQNRASNLHGRATYTGGSRNMCRTMERLKGQIIEDGDTPTLLKLYLGTHSSSVDKITGEYIYPDNNTKEYCVSVNVIFVLFRTLLLYMILW